MSINAINFEPIKNSNSFISGYLAGKPQVELLAKQNVATNPLLSQSSNYRPSEKADDGSSHKLHDEILPNDVLTKIKVGIETAASVPEYAVRGLKGDPDSNFYEYLKLGKVPYYIGGPMLAGMFLAGVKNEASQSKIFSLGKTKQMAAGVVLYYAAAALANMLIDVPVKQLRGLDLNHPYRDVVDLRATSPSGIAPKRNEYHTVCESMDFTRFDLLYGQDDKTKPGVSKINENYDKMAKKFGIDKESNDSDSTLKSYIKSTIAMSRAWKYALTVPLVALSLGLAKQDVWKNVGTGLGNSIRSVIAPSSKLVKSFQALVDPKETLIKTSSLFRSVCAYASDLASDLNMKNRFDTALSVISSNTIKPLKNSFVSFWNGQLDSKASGVVGKTVILASILLPLYANFRILQRSSAKNEKIVDVSKPETNKAIGG